VCKLLLLALGCLLWLNIGPARADGKKSGFLRQSYKDSKGQPHAYVLFVPHDYKGDKPYPLILFLHGLGECGTDGKQAEVGIGPAIQKREQSFPFITLFPQAAQPSPDFASTWRDDQPAGEQALAILDAVQKQYNVDKKRVYLTGLSMGGY